MSRIARLREELIRQNLPNFIVTRLSNIRYLCGFSGSAGTLLITPKKVRFFSDFRYQEQAAEQVHSAEVIIYRNDLIQELRRRSVKLKGKIGFEAAFLDVETFDRLQNLFPNVEWVPTAKRIENIASVKEPEEVARIKKAAAITDSVFNDILKDIKPGVRERDISAEISYLTKRKGADGDCFDPIVASGPRSALPHGIASDRKIKSGDLVTIDMGCFYNGYASDLTRTVTVGKADSKAVEIHSLVLRAQSAAIAAARPGINAKELDEVARKVIRGAGYADYFGHGLGHGLGLEVHAEPRISYLSNDDLVAGQVFTIEPGVYIPGFGGVRIEDDVHLSDSGCEVLTQSPRELIEV